MSFLIAAKVLRIKQLYLDIKDSIPVNASLHIIFKFVAPVLDKAFTEGVKYASVVDDKKIPKDIVFTKVQELVAFTIGYDEAKRIRDFKIKNRQRILTAQGVKDFTGDEQIKQIQVEFENKIKGLVNRAIIAAGNQGQKVVFESGT